MPTYSYKCTVCDAAFDIQQSFTDDSLTQCPECAGKLRKLYSAVGVSFTGSGFYRNDSRAAARTSSSGSTSTSSGAKKDSAGTSKETVSSAPASTSAGSSSGSTTAAAS